MDVAAHTERSGPPAGVLVLAVVGAILLGGLLLVLVIRTPEQGARFSVGNAIGTACPIGEGSPVCFEVTVTNTGNEASVVHCEVIAADGNRAMFLDGDTRYASGAPLAPGQPLALTLAVDTDTDTVFTPDVACDRP